MNSKKTYHVITGLPRSGSTLLSCILNQNPRFSSSISNKVHTLFCHVVDNGPHEFGITPDFPQEKRKKIIQGIFDSYYYDVDAEVIFNTNRGWLLDLHNLKYVYPRVKFIVCVRSIVEILNSFEQALRKAPLMKSSIFTRGGPSMMFPDVYARVDWLMADGSDSDIGQVFGAYKALKQAVSSAEIGDTIFVEYETLCKSPENVLKSIYAFIDEPYFEHDFNNIESNFEKWDEILGIPIHKVKPKIEYNPPKMVLPPDLIERYHGIEFWRNK